MKLPWVHQSPVATNFFMENFEEVALSREVYKPMCWFHYIDDTFVIWTYGPKELKNFLNNLNNIHLNK